MEYIWPFLPESIKRIEVHMDFEGQDLSERLFKYILVTAGVIGFIVGYISQELSHTVFILLAGLGISGLVCLPPWPMYRKHPLHWQPASTTDDEDESKKQSPKQETSAPTTTTKQTKRRLA